MDDYLAARCTDEGSLAGVDPHVRRQLLRLSERFTTDLKYTAKRAYSLLWCNQTGGVRYLGIIGVNSCPVQVQCQRFYVKPYKPFIHVSVPVSIRDSQCD